MQLKSISIGIFIISIFLFSGCVGETPNFSDDYTPPTGMIIYESIEDGIRISYPQDWSVTEGVMGTIAAFSSPAEFNDVFAENANIGTEDLSTYGPITLEEYTNITIDTLRTFFVTNMEIEQSTAITFAGSQGYKIVYTGTMGETRFKTMQVWTIKNKKAYLITYMAEPEDYSTHVGTIEKMIDSLEIS